MKNKKEYFLAIIYFFGQSIQYINKSIGYFLAGNFNLFYLGGPLYILKNIKKRNVIQKILILLAVALLYIFIQFLFLNKLNVVRSLINILKIFCCFLLMLYIKDNYSKISLIKFAKIVAYVSIILLIFAFLLKDSILWRHNDFINKFDLTRLQYLFLEPSELGFYLMIIEIILFSYLLYARNKCDKFQLFVLFIINVLILYLTKSVGTIVIGTLSILTIFILYYKYNFARKKIINIIFAIIASSILGLLIISKGSLGKRIDAVINGKDSSVNYRLNVALNVCNKTLLDTNFIGIGFGNLELDYNFQKYQQDGLTDSGIVSSYFNFIAEGGIFAIFVVIVLNTVLIKKCIKDKSILKWGLLIFVFFYQIVGSYFTNPLCWIIYGLIISDFNEKNNNMEDVIK